MTRFHYWKSGTAALMAMAITTGAIVPMFAPAPATAQDVFRSQTRTVSIPAGVRIPVTYEKDRILVTPDETTRLTLKVARNIVDRSGNVLIPQGTEVVGKLEPANTGSRKGSQFVAQELVYPNGEQQDIDATSQVITRTQTIKKGASTGRILTDSAIGAGAASVISLLTGNRRIETIEPIIGAGAGAAASVFLRKKEAEVVVIEPERGDLNLTLRSNLLVSRQY